MGSYAPLLDKQLVIEELISFLEAPVPSEDAGLAPVSRDDLVALSTLFYNIIQCKFERDCDGTLPVDYELCNKHKSHFIPLCTVPYTNDNVLNSRVQALVDIQAYASEQLKHSLEFFIARCSRNKEAQDGR